MLKYYLKDRDAYYNQNSKYKKIKFKGFKKIKNKTTKIFLDLHLHYPNEEVLTLKDVCTTICRSLAILETWQKIDVDQMNFNCNFVFYTHLHTRCKSVRLTHHAHWVTLMSTVNDIFQKNVLSFFKVILNSVKKIRRTI